MNDTSPLTRPASNGVDTSSTKPKVTPKDFFLWAGAMAALYGSIVSFITLLFEYIEYAFPDTLQSYADPYAGGIRFAIASLIVLFPTFLVLIRLIRRDIGRDTTRSEIWVRRWVLYLTLFIAGITLIIDLIALINTYLGGDLTTRFVLKVLVVFLVVGAGFLHFLSDLRGYWNRYPRRARMVGYGAALAIALSVGAGFFIIGSPATERLYRIDEQKISDLQNIQWQVVNYYQQKQKLPADLMGLEDPLGGFSSPRDPESGEEYGYRITAAPYSFELCAVFNKESRGFGVSTPKIPSGRGDVEGANWQHEEGRGCFERTIDPERYPPLQPLKS